MRNHSGRCLYFIRPTWRFGGPFATLLTTGVTDKRPVRATIDGVGSPVMSSY